LRKDSPALEAVVRILTVRILTVRILTVGRPLVVALFLATVVSGCGAEPSGGSAGPATGGPTAQSTSTPAAAERREVDVYAAVLRHHLADRTPRGPVYLVDRAVPDAADPMRANAAAGGAAIAAPVREQLINELADLGPISFVPDADAVIDPAGGCPTVNGGGLVLTLAPVPATGDRLEIGLGDFRACLDGRWQTYVVIHQNGDWTVHGTTGPVSIA